MLNSLTGQGSTSSFASELTKNIGIFFGNILSSYYQGQVVHARSSRKKRSLCEGLCDNSEIDDYNDDYNGDDVNVEGRILPGHNENKVQFFPKDDSSESVHRYVRKYTFPTTSSISSLAGLYNNEDTYIKSYDLHSQRNGKQTNFIDNQHNIRTTKYSEKNPFYLNNENENLSLNPRGSDSLNNRLGQRMIFPENRDDVNPRKGRIVNRNPYVGNVKRKPDLNQNIYSSGSKYYSDWNHQHHTTQRPVPKEDDPNVYVTNSRGVIEYVIDAKGKKVYV